MTAPNEPASPTPPQDIFNPSYWEQRLETHAATEHQAVFKCTREEWDRVADKHRSDLAAYIKTDDNILDVGCAWGRLLDLLPKSWRGTYVGLDICEGFLERARKYHPNRTFINHDVRQPVPVDLLPGVIGHHYAFDWGILISFRPMVIRNAGEDTWKGIEANLHKVCRKLMYLELNTIEPVSVEWAPSGD